VKGIQFLTIITRDGMNPCLREGYPGYKSQELDTLHEDMGSSHLRL
jgi:hypothetical protein